MENRNPRPSLAVSADTKAAKTGKCLDSSCVGCILFVVH